MSWLNYAFRFLQLPIGVFGVAIAHGVDHPLRRRRRRRAIARRWSRHLVEGLRLVAFLCVPATVGLLVLGEPIIRLIYQRGAFHAWDTTATAAALDLYVRRAGRLRGGQGARAGVLRHEAAPASRWSPRWSRSPATWSSTCCSTRIYGYRVLALGTALSAILNFARSCTSTFHRRIAPIPHGALVRYLLRIGLAAAVMGAATWATWYGLDHVLGQHGFAVRVTDALVPVAVGAAVYAAACSVLRVEELDQFVGRVQRRAPIAGAVRPLQRV